MPLSMHLTCLLAGLGSLLFSLILKATPESWVDKINVSFGESSFNKEKNSASKISKKMGNSKVRKGDYA